MNTTLTKTDDLNAVLNIVIDENDYVANVDKAIANYRKNANIPGFRPGKVPIGLIKKQYGKGVLIEEINQQLQKEVSDYITKEKLDLLGNPMPVEQTDIDWDNDKSFSFNFELGLAPQLEVKFPARKKFTYHNIKATKEAIDEQIDNMAKRYGKMSVPEEAVEDDMFSGSFTEIGADGVVVSGGIHKEGAYFVGSAIATKGVKSKVLKSSIGDDITINASDFTKGYDVANLMGVNAHQLDDHSTGIFMFTVTHISRMEPADLNQELFDKVFSEGVVSSEDEFKAKVTEDIERMYTRDSDQQLMNDVHELLMEKTEVKLPEEFLKKWMRTSGEKELTEAEVEVEFPGMIKGLKWQLIENRIVKDNNLTVEYEELLDYAKGLLRQQYIQYGMEPQEEELTKSATEVLKKQEEAQQISDRLYDEKIKNHLKSTLKLDEKDISYDDFVKLVTPEKA